MKRNGFVIDFLDFFLKKNRHWEITEVGAGATEMVGAGATGVN